jgi:membrane-associated HD superfamily phosphohydrolase
MRKISILILFVFSLFLVSQVTAQNETKQDVKKEAKTEVKQPVKVETKSEAMPPTGVTIKTQSTQSQVVPEIKQEKKKRRDKKQRASKKAKSHYQRRGKATAWDDNKKRNDWHCRVRK